MNHNRSQRIVPLLAVALAAVMTAAPGLAAQALKTVHESQNRTWPSGATSPDWTSQNMCRKLGTYSGSSTVIMKKTSGAGSTADNRYREVMRTCQNPGQRFVGYVGTGRTRVSLEQATHDIDIYYDRYPDIDGIFLADSAANPDVPTAHTSDAPELTVGEYYRRIFDHVRSKNMMQAWVTSTTRLPRVNYVVGDYAAGTAPVWQLSARVVDNLVVFDSAADRFRRWSEPSLLWKDDPSTFDHVVYTVNPHTGGFSFRTAQQLSRDELPWD